MADTDLTKLDPALAEKYMVWMSVVADEFARRGLAGGVRIIQGFRSPDYQEWLKAKGASRLGGNKSLHCCTVGGKPASRAFDFGVFEDDGRYVTDGRDPRYTAAGSVAEALGLRWGGRFRRPDWDHVELPQNLS